MLRADQHRPEPRPRGGCGVHQQWTSRGAPLPWPDGGAAAHLGDEMERIAGGSLAARTTTHAARALASAAVTHPKRSRGAAALRDRQCSPKRSIGAAAGAVGAVAGRLGRRRNNQRRSRCERPPRAADAGPVEVREAPLPACVEHCFRSLAAPALAAARQLERAVAAAGGGQPPAGAVRRRLRGFGVSAAAPRRSSRQTSGCRGPAVAVGGCASSAKSISLAPSRAGTRWGPRPRCRR